jgi:imidazolonepropionase-like amidohydrolase
MRRALEATVKLARDRGLLVGLGTDAGGNPLVPHDCNMAHELEELVALGYPPLEALSVATHANARILRLSHDLGTLEPGKLADFVVLARSPGPRRFRDARPRVPAPPINSQSSAQRGDTILS